MKSILFSFCLLLISCNANKSHPVKDLSEVPTGFTAVTVRNFSGLDGCAFLLVVNDSLRFEPVGFPDSLKVDSLELFIRYKPVQDYMSICMSGSAVKLTEVQYRRK